MPSTAGSTSTRWPAPRSRCSPARRRSSATMIWPSCGPRCRPRPPPCPGTAGPAARGRRGAAPGAGQVSGRSLPDLPGLRGRAAGGAGPARPVARPAGADGGPRLDHGLGRAGPGSGIPRSTRRPRSPTPVPPVPPRRRGRARPRSPATSQARRVSSLRRLRRDRCRGPARQRRRLPDPGPRPSAIRGPGCSRRPRTGRARAGWSPRHPPSLRTNPPSSHPSTRGPSSHGSRRRASRLTRPRADPPAGARRARRAHRGLGPG